MERNGSGMAALVIRSIGVFALGSAITTAGWMYWKFEDAAKERDSLRQRVAVLETSVRQFHTNFYSWRDKHERIDERQDEEIRRNSRNGRP